MKTILEQPIETLPVDPPEFSLVLGGALFQLYRRSHLSGAALERLYRQAILFTLVTWLPLLFLSFLDRHVIRSAGIQVPFLHDIEANVRFLVALPVLILAELGVQKRVSPLIRRFIDRRIIEVRDLPAFAAAVASAQRVRDLVAVEVVVLILVYTIGLWVWRSQIAWGDRTWYALPDKTHLHLTLAGYWYAFVSIPIFQFLLMRWYLRLAIWFRLLWQISKLHLRLSAAHPDRAGGIGFIGGGSFAFAPILFAQGALLSGFIADRVLIGKQPLMSFKLEAIGTVVFLVVVILGPLLMFTPQLASTLRKSSAEYGLMASRFVWCFEEKWMRRGDYEPEELLRNEDVRSLAEMSNVYEDVRQMRLVPFWTNDIIRLAVAVAIPLVPLSLTVLSPAELLKFVLKIAFK
jgi:hypothetical protein